MENTPSGAQPKIIATGDLFRSTWSDYRANWKKFAYLLILPLSISFIASLGSFALENYFNARTWPLPVAVAAFIVMIALIVAFFILYILTFISEFILLGDLSQDVSFSNLGQWYKRAKPYFWTIIAVSLVYAVISLLGLILLVIPGVIFMVMYCFAIYFVLFEQSKFEGAFGQSRELVKGYWWAVFGRFVAGGAAIYLAYVIIGGLHYGLISLMANLMHIASSKALFDLTYSLLSVFIGLIAGPMSIIYTYKIFRSLKEIHPVN